jgi:hypothetical protein
MARLVLVLLLLAGPAFADAAAVLKALGERQASLLDLSIARVNALLSVVGEKHGFGAFAWPQDGGILILANAYGLPRTRGACRGVIEAIRRAGGINPKTGVPDQPASGYAAMFEYPTLDSFKVDETYAETVDAMFRLRVTVGVAGDGKAVTCAAPLVNGAIAYGKE